jgi:hypothetical protein
MPLLTWTTPTTAMPDHVPEFLGAVEPRPIRLRDPERFEHLGSIFTHPDEDTLVVGLSYLRRHDGEFREDLFSIDLGTGELEPHYRGRYERIDPRYADTHSGPKTFLL